MKTINNFFSVLLILLPLSLISGPAIPDITITFAVLFLLFYLFYNKNIDEVFEFLWFKISFFFWLYLLASSLFAYNIYVALGESIVFLRFLFIPFLIYFFLFNSSKNTKFLFITIFISIIIVILDSLFQFFNYSYFDINCKSVG